MGVTRVCLTLTCVPGISWASCCSSRCTKCCARRRVTWGRCTSVTSTSRVRPAGYWGEPWRGVPLQRRWRTALVFLLDTARCSAWDRPSHGPTSSGRWRAAAPTAWKPEPFWSFSSRWRSGCASRTSNSPSDGVRLLLRNFLVISERPFIGTDGRPWSIIQDIVNR